MNVKELAIALPKGEVESVIREGVIIRLPLFEAKRALAKEKIESFTRKYKKKYSYFKIKGLPQKANYSMHEDYIECGHWENILFETEKTIRWFNKIIKKTFGKN